MAKDIVRKLSAAHLSARALCSAVFFPSHATVFCGVKAESSAGDNAGASLLQSGKVNPAAPAARNARLSILFIGLSISPPCLVALMPRFIMQMQANEPI